MNSRTTTEQQTLSEYNRARTLQYLHHHGIASRAQIAKALHLTPAALSKISNHLLASGAIVEDRCPRRQRQPQVNRTGGQCPGVPGARRQIRAQSHRDRSVRPRRQAIVHTRTTHRGEHDDSAGHRKPACRNQTPARRAPAHPGHRHGPCRGPYLRDRGHTAVVSSMGQWRQVNFRAEFEHAFDVPVIIEQDAPRRRTRPVSLRPESGE
jgi:N-acetylglucosamine repressor